MKMAMMRRPRTGGLVIPFSPSRRRFVTGAAGGLGWLALGAPGRAAGGPTDQGSNPPELRGSRFDLDIGSLPVNFTGRQRTATVIGGSLPAPTLRWREGDRIAIRVSNRLGVDSSIHWHGMILPEGMDGVPGISFPGIPPGETFEYRFDVRQGGTYWYHSHSGFQEQTGMYGAIVIEPAGGEAFPAEREHIIVLSDWSDQRPEAIYARLKKDPHFFNMNPRTVGDLFRDIGRLGLSGARRDRAMWNAMRMNDRDISDVTGYTYTFLMNGRPPADGAFFPFRAGERVRLRIINAAAMTFFDFRIPGLDLRVVAADGQDIEPVTVDEIRLGVAETYDAIVEPRGDAAYPLFAQAIDRSGYAFGTLAPDPSRRADPPPLDPPGVLTHADMGMQHGAGMDHAAMDTAMDHAAMDHAAMGHGPPAPAPEPEGMSAAAAGAPGGMGAHAGHHGAGHGSPAGAGNRPPPEPALGPAGFGSRAPIRHPESERSVWVDMRVDAPRDALSDPGVGLRETGRRVLLYSDLRLLRETADRREPEREIELHLTGNMERYMWSFGGVPHRNAEPVPLRFGERVRFVLVNDTMMNHPIHLHGMWSELETGDGARMPRKHTVVVQPGAKLSYLVTADAPGRWAYHCHLLYHMPGMFREVEVT